MKEIERERYSDGEDPESGRRAAAYDTVRCIAHDVESESERARDSGGAALETRTVFTARTGDWPNGGGDE